MPMKIPDKQELMSLHCPSCRGDINRMDRPCSSWVLWGGFVGLTLRSLLQGKGLGLCSFFPAFPNAALPEATITAPARPGAEQSRGAPLSQAFLRR